MKTTIIATLLATALTISAAAAESTRTPVYIGLQTGNPEKDTYAFRRAVHGGSRLAFIGPAHLVGPSTGDPEKDTSAYQPVLLEDIADAN